jgi:hypothetical protein
MLLREAASASSTALLSSDAADQTRRDHQFDERRETNLTSTSFLVPELLPTLFC